MMHSSKAEQSSAKSLGKYYGCSRLLPSADYKSQIFAVAQYLQNQYHISFRCIHLCCLSIELDTRTLTITSMRKKKTPIEELIRYHWLSVTLKSPLLFLYFRPQATPECVANSTKVRQKRHPTTPQNPLNCGHKSSQTAVTNPAKLRTNAAELRRKARQLCNKYR